MDGSNYRPDDYRAVTVDDIPWILSLGYRRYGAYDPGKMLVYLLNAVRNPDGLLIRTDDALCISALILPVWRTSPHECHVIAAVAEKGKHWQLVRLLKRSLAWARERGCDKWIFGSETDTDVSALAKRVGGIPFNPRYRIEL